MASLSDASGKHPQVHFRGAGGRWSPPKLGGGGFAKRAQLTRLFITHDELWCQSRRKKILSIENGRFFFSSNTWQMMIFLNPLDALPPKIPFSFCAELWVQVTSGGLGSVLVGFLGGTSVEPFLGEGVSLARRLYRPPTTTGDESPCTPALERCGQGDGMRRRGMQQSVMWGSWQWRGCDGVEWPWHRTGVYHSVPRMQRSVRRMYRGVRRM